MVVLAGCVTEFKSTTGTVYRWDEGGDEAAPVASARADLGCATEKIQVRRLSIYRSNLHAADGCGARGIYVLECSTSRVRTYTPDRRDATETQSQSGYGCEFVLISRFKLAPEPQS
jgi:hypothetical protein